MNTGKRKKNPKRQSRELGDLIEIWSPSEIENYVGLVASAYRTFATDLAGNPVFAATELQAWNDLYARFLKWHNGVGFFSKLTVSTVRTAEDYAKQLSYWRQLYNTKSKLPATGPDEVRVSPDKQLDAWKTMVLAGTVAVVAIAASYMVYKFKR